MLTIIIPAYNEESVIKLCLNSLLDQTYVDKTVYGPLEILIVANGCRDQTVKVCNNYRDLMKGRGILFEILELAKGNKNRAINLADKTARYPARMYLDADVVCETDLVSQIVSLLNTNEPRYASGELAIQDGSSFASHAYGKIWRETPYIRDTIPGCGCYAVNSAGRKLWGEFPMIHSDDKYVRLLFLEHQKKQAQAKYFWPLPQGFFTLLKIRIRWIRGNRQLAFQFPELSKNDAKRIRVDMDFIKTILHNPISSAIFLCIYVSAAVAVYLRPRSDTVHWSRAR